MTCEQCGGVLSMSATSGGTTWWRCTVCQHVQGAPAASPPPPAPAVAPGANKARYASGGHPAYASQNVPATSSPRPTLARSRSGPASVGAVSPSGVSPTEAISNVAVSIDAVPGAKACGVCGAGDVQYILETDVGVDAATLASGQVIRAGFCSIDCLAEKLGLVRAFPDGG